MDEVISSASVEDINYRLHWISTSTDWKTNCYCYLWKTNSFGENMTIRLDMNRFEFKFNPIIEKASHYWCVPSWTTFLETHASFFNVEFLKSKELKSKRNQISFGDSMKNELNNNKSQRQNITSHLCILFFWREMLFFLKRWLFPSNSYDSIQYHWRSHREFAASYNFALWHSH